MKTNRFELLTAEVTRIYNENKIEIENLSRVGPKGGHNAKHIDGWYNIGNQTITKACHSANVPTLSYWSGSGLTPSTAVPTVIKDQLVKAYDLIYGI